MTSGIPANRCKDAAVPRSLRQLVDICQRNPRAASTEPGWPPWSDTRSARGRLRPPACPSSTSAQHPGLSRGANVAWNSTQRHAGAHVLVESAVDAFTHIYFLLVVRMRLGVLLAFAIGGRPAGVARADPPEQFLGARAVASIRRATRVEVRRLDPNYDMYDGDPGDSRNPLRPPPAKGRLAGFAVTTDARLFPPPLVPALRDLLLAPDSYAVEGIGNKACPLMPGVALRFLSPEGSPTPPL